MCFDFLYNLCLKHFSFYDEMQETGQKMYIRPHVKYALFLSDFGETWILSTHLRKIFKYQVSLKSAQWDPSYSMRTYRRAWIYESLFAILPTRQGKQPPPSTPFQLQANHITKITALRYFAQQPRIRFTGECAQTNQKSWRLGFGSSKYKAL